MCESNDDDKKNAENPIQKPTSVPPNPPLSTSPGDHVFKKPSIPPLSSSRKKVCATTQKLTSQPAIKRSSVPPIPPPSKRPSVPAEGSPAKKPNTSPTPPATPPSPPKQSSGIPISANKYSVVRSPTKKLSSSPKAPSPKKPTSLPTGKRLQPLFNIEQFADPPPIPTSKKPPCPVQIRSPSNLPFSVTALSHILENILTQGPPPGAKKPPPPPPSFPPPTSLPFQTTHTEDDRFDYNQRWQQELLDAIPPSLRDPLHQRYLEICGITQETSASSETSGKNFDSEIPLPKKGPKTPPENPNWDIPRPERPQNPAFGRPPSPPTSSIIYHDITPSTGKIFIRNDLYREEVCDLNNSEETRSPPDTAVTFATTLRPRFRRLQFFEDIRRGLELPPPFTASQECKICKENNKEQCKNCHQFQPICRLCPACEAFRHFACFEEGCYNPSYWLDWICRHCSNKPEDTYISHMFEKRRVGMSDTEELEWDYGESQEVFFLADKENTPPSKNTKKKRSQLDVPQVMKSPMATVNNPSNLEKTPTKCPLQENKSSASFSELPSALKELIIQSQKNNVSLTITPLTSTVPASPKASTSATSTVSVSPIDSTTGTSAGPKASTSRMSASPKASSSNMATPERNQHGDNIRAPNHLDYCEYPNQLVEKRRDGRPEVPISLYPVKTNCRICYISQPITRYCFRCEQYVNVFTCRPGECWRAYNDDNTIDLNWYCTSCIEDHHIPQLLLENFCYACFTPMPLEKKCQNCNKFYIYHCHFPYKCIITHYPRVMGYARWTHCQECLDVSLVGYSEPLEFARLMTNLEPWYEEIVSILLSDRRRPSVKRSLDEDEGGQDRDDFSNKRFNFYR